MAICCSLLEEAEGSKTHLETCQIWAELRVYYIPPFRILYPWEIFVQRETSLAASEKVAILGENLRSRMFSIMKVFVTGTQPISNSPFLPANLHRSIFFYYLFIYLLLGRRRCKAHRPFISSLLGLLSVFLVIPEGL